MKIPFQDDRILIFILGRYSPLGRRFLMSKKYRLLMLTTLIISGCSMCYELIISAISSYLVGNSTLQYSTVIGLYMFAMGCGSYLSRFMRRSLFDWFVSVELLVGLAGGTCSLVLFLAHLYIASYAVVMYAEVIIIGALVGAEIPLLTRIIEDDGHNLRITLSSIFSFDYIGGLVGSIAFPLLLLPHLGYFATAFLMGLFNTIAAGLVVWKYRRRIIRAAAFRHLAVLACILMAFGLLYSESISRFIIIDDAAVNSGFIWNESIWGEFRLKPLEML